MRIFIFVIGLMVGCAQEKGPQDDLTEAQFVVLCVDVLALQTDDVSPDSLGGARDAVFQKHGVTRDEVAQFIAHRKAHPETWESVVMLLKERLGEKAEISLKAFQDAKPESLKHKKAGQ
ncbi:MAG: hypothetical protein HOH77_06245 [Candidatus Latescibacteria bacterium]|nr:hypothetical protein [Candidatus Latescibacterota bacterium]